MQMNNKVKVLVTFNISLCVAYSAVTTLGAAYVAEIIYVNDVPACVAVILRIIYKNRQITYDAT